MTFETKMDNLSKQKALEAEVIHLASMAQDMELVVEHPDFRWNS